MAKHTEDIEVKGIETWKDLNTAVRDTKSKLVELQQAGKTGTAEWEKYSQKLRDLTRQKQIIQREIKLTSTQLLGMSRDFTVVGMGIRNMIQDIQNLGKENKTIGETALSISSIGVQALTVMPAISSLTRSLQAMGVVSASTVTSLKAFSGVIATASGYFAVFLSQVLAVGAAFDAAIGAIGNFGKVLDGTMTLTQMGVQFLKDMSFGIVDLEDKGNKFDSTEFQQQLSDIAYIANFAANALGDLRNQVSGAVEKNLEKFRRSGLTFIPEMTEDEMKRSWREIEQANKRTKKGGRTTSSITKILEEEKTWLDQILAQQKKLNTEISYFKNLVNDGNQEFFIRLNAYDELIKKQEELNRLTGRFGLPLPKTLDVLGGGEISPRTIAQDDPMRHLFDERIQKEIELYKGEIAAAEKTLSIFQDSVNLLEQFFGIQLPKEFDLLMNMLSQFIQGLGGGGSGLFGLLGNLAMSFIPGGQLIQGLAGGATPQGMINRPVGITGGRPVINQIIIKNPITLREALEVHESYMNKKNG